MSENFYGKGIPVTSGFDLSAKSPLDSRNVVNTLTERDEHVNNNRAYEGMLVYVVENKNTYQLVDGEWEIFGFQSSSEIDTNEVIDNLYSTSPVNPLSANQGRILKELIVVLEANVYSKSTIDNIKMVLDNKDLEITEMLNQVKATIPIKMSELENDSDFTTTEYVNVKISEISIPSKLSDLENDTEYVTKDELEEVLENVDISDGSGGDGFVYIGSEEPETNYLWIDTSIPSNLAIVNYDERIKLKYIEMLGLIKTRLSNLNDKLSLIETNINEISSDNANKISTFKSTLGSIRSQISVLVLSIENLISKDEIEKEKAKQLRKESKVLMYSLCDFNDEVMRILDSEISIDDSNSDTNEDVTTDGASLLTEDGLVLLTEDGLMLLADGVATSTILADAILTELGLAILTEDEKQILKG